MGYDLHIARSDDWTDSVQNPIRGDEWLAYLKRDKDLKLAGINGPYFAIFSSATGADPGPWLDWRDGELYSKYPNLRMVRKMIAIAAVFGAKVQGDDGEIYTETELHGVDEMET
jgi:hypothetical protein